MLEPFTSGRVEGPAGRSHGDVPTWATRWGWLVPAAQAASCGAGGGRAIRAGVFTHKLLDLLERAACKVLIAQ